MKLSDLSKNIFILNLKKRNDRLEHIKTEMSKIDCKEYKIFESVDGSLLENKTRLTNGMLGLVKTYIKLHEELLKTNYQDVIIIEDDCVFIENFNNLLKEYIDSIPKNWDFLYFGANHNRHMGYTTTKINENVLKLTYSFTAHCVLIKKVVFDELIENIKNLNIENDVMLARLQQKYNAYSSSKILTSQLPNFSNIENKNVNYSHLII